MSNFQGTNNFRLTRFAFYERLRFKLEAYKHVNHSNLKEVNFSSLGLYGKIDHRYDTIYPKKESIIYTTDNRPAMNFVADAFNSVVEHFRRANNFERISPDEKYLSDLKCYSGYMDPLEQYSSYIDSVMEQYNFNYLRHDKIKNFKDYLSQLIPYAKFLRSEFPLTFSGWIGSKRCSPFMTGLYLNVSNENFGDDMAKEKDFLNSRNLNFYLDTCKSRGFYVAKSNPSVLVADIKSAPMKSFMNERNIGDVFAINYNVAYERDIELLRNKIIEYYNIFINNRQVIFKQKISKNNKLYTKIEYINNKYNINNINNIIYKLYINIRNIEEDYVYGDADIEYFIKTAKKLEKKFDKQKAISYINIKFRSTYASKYGGLNYYDKKFDSMED